MRLIPAISTTRSYTAVYGVAVVALVLTACGQGGDDAADSADDDMTPLEQYLGESAISFAEGGIQFAVAGAQEMTEEERQNQRDLEEKVEECMTEKGFEYYPNVSEGEANKLAEAYSLPDDEFAEQYGYGISTLMFTDDSDEEANDNPNQEYRDSLSAQAQEEYDQALHGDMTSFATSESDGEGAVTAGPPEDADFGCYGDAADEIYGPRDEGSATDPFLEFDSLMDDLFQLGERVKADPRVAEATDAWRNCMADAGHPDFENVSEPEQQVFQRMNELRGTLAPDDAEAGIAPPEEDDIDPEALAELQEFELELAQADYTCKDDHYNEVAHDVSRELEQEFVEQHRDELEQFRDQMADRSVMGGVSG